jgi:hypothetical protein
MVFSPNFVKYSSVPVNLPIRSTVSIFPLLVTLITFYEDHNLRSSSYRIQVKDGTAVKSELTSCRVVRYVALSLHPEHHWHHTSLQLKWVPGNLFAGVQRQGHEAENLTSKLEMRGATKLLHTSSYMIIKYYPDYFYRLPFLRSTFSCTLS